MSLAAPLLDDARWYCVHTKPRAELQALEHLQRQAFECFLPRVLRSVLRAGKRQRLIEPLFPRYLFLRANASLQNLAVVRSTRGALGVVRFANKPGEVPDGLIQHLKHDANGDGLIALPETGPQLGDSVTVQGGAFEGMQGIYTETSGAHRAIVLLNLLGSAQRVQLPRELLQTTRAVR
ncbi:MAG: transcription/translation regulatory transformer protein RfaH [Thermomonas sp.]|uniref:transcription termination/antitermination protein NusG n=1 Tax=Thermomonas sp. TaxID=1971895 RepID=UPI001ECB1B76|nr:transcription termination/antitermination NusG family protein [Thermomonas sp.]MBV2208594.1 transcription/translation regulatory transformer protein RfaH [Thermomonas sp.]